MSRPIVCRLLGIAAQYPDEESRDADQDEIKDRRKEIREARIEKVERAMHEMKRGELKSGRSGKTVKSRKQAIAIGLSEARKQGAKVPKAS